VNINTVVELSSGPMPSTRKLRNLKRAGAKVVVSEDVDRMTEAYAVIEDTLLRRHNVRPVHSQEELQDLFHRIPEAFGLFVARARDEVVGTVVVIKNPYCWHAQYIAGTPEGLGLGAVDKCLLACMTEAKSVGARYFSLGVSNDPTTGDLNSGLYTFKSEFGGGGVRQEQWTLSL
jgi:hypothetical protein